MKKAMTEIVGNNELKNRLCADILADTLPHACIIEGRKGTGKHTIAKMCAAALACEKKQDASVPIPCLDCLECKKVIEGKSPDFITVGTEDKASIGVETVRFLREDVHTVPNDLEYKIYVIEDADKMTVQAQNALLLTLEEPPKYVRFFLLCENSNMLLETIKSRAPIHRTEPIDTKQIDEYICKHDRRAAQMKLSSPKEYEQLLKAAGAGIGCALDYLDPRVFAPILERRTLVTSFIEAAVGVKSKDTLLPLLTRFSSKRDTLKEQLLTLFDAVRDLILLKKSDSASLLFYANRNDAIELCDRVSLIFLYGLAEAIEKAIDSNSKNANVRLALMTMMYEADLI